jgi:hypothetical protein
MPQKLLIFFFLVNHRRPLAQLSKILLEALTERSRTYLNRCQQSLCGHGHRESLNRINRQAPFVLRTETQASVLYNEESASNMHVLNHLTPRPRPRRLCSIGEFSGSPLTRRVVFAGSCSTRSAEHKRHRQQQQERPSRHLEPISSR